MNLNSGEIIPNKSQKYEYVNKMLYQLKMYKGLLFLLIPPLIWYIVFCYFPMYGVVIAFKDFKVLKGILGSPWAGEYGFHHFIRFLTSYSFMRVLSNTLILSFYKLVICFPVPIVLALLINEIKNNKFKKTIQTISYLPHFMSWVVIASLVREILNPAGGVANIILNYLGQPSVNFLLESAYFRPIVILSVIWKESGWGSIVFLAAISGLDSEVYEAAEMDGANRLQKALYITIPSIIPVILIMFILKIGNILDAGFDEIINLYNPAVYDVGDIIDTYVYRVGLQDFDYSYSAAVGLFKNVVGLVLLIFTNKVTKKIGDGDYGLW